MSCFSSSSDDQRALVQVVLPEPEAASSDAATDPGAATVSASSAAPDNATASLVAKATAELSADLAALAQDPKRKACSKDPGWKYGFWPELGKKEPVQCIFCKKIVTAGIKRFKQYLAGGYANVLVILLLLDM
ncbi:uncharacterized protein LOC133926697 [Phragmites australis]|uniref:uncharacterized protein LOC133926697 n=1 Tax=Phragmites australis TaxID=29695 RepID=UPI002D774D89|nr:uncharacterized protein LOC133926697 [Phragmites australis]